MGKPLKRMTVELYEGDEETLVRRARAAAAMSGESLREWVLRAIKAQLEAGVE